MPRGKFKKWIQSQGGPKVLAERLGLTSHAVRVWLRGAGSPTMKTAHRIVKLSRGRLTLEDIVTFSRRNAS